MLWLFYWAWLTDVIGLVPGASPEARLLPVKCRDPGSIDPKARRHEHEVGAH
jgi:hypothetical protein